MTPNQTATRRKLFQISTWSTWWFFTTKRISIIVLLICCMLKPAHSIRCEMARLKCALRNGCGFSLRNYMMECTDLIAGRTQQCNPQCERALIGLISSDEGKELIDCDCDGNRYCLLSKSRIEVCRKSVYNAVAADTIVSCSTARWICISDQLCKTALEYYQVYCRSLFHEQKCTHRCNNSLSILDRQEKAIKLRTCYCDGSENFPCKRVKLYTERMCYGRGGQPQDPETVSFDDNYIEPIGRDGDGGKNGNKYQLYQLSSSSDNNDRNRLRSGSISIWSTTNNLLICWAMIIGKILIFR